MMVMATVIVTMAVTMAVIEPLVTMMIVLGVLVGLRFFTCIFGSGKLYRCWGGSRINGEVRFSVAKYRAPVHTCHCRVVKRSCNGLT